MNYPPYNKSDFNNDGSFNSEPHLNDHQGFEASYSDSNINGAYPDTYSTYNTYNSEDTPAQQKS